MNDDLQHDRIVVLLCCLTFSVILHCNKGLCSLVDGRVLLLSHTLGLVMALLVLGALLLGGALLFLATGCLMS